MAFVSIYIVGDNIELNGEVVATLKPNLRSTLRGELDDVIEAANTVDGLAEKNEEYKKALESIKSIVDDTEITL